MILNGKYNLFDGFQVNAVEWSQTRNENFILSASWDKLIKMVSGFCYFLSVFLE